MKYYVEIVLTNDKKINLELDDTYAKVTVDNFVNLVKNHYYDGVIFHRVIKDFMIQTGGYKIEDGSLVEADETPSIKGEFSSNGVNNPMKHELGVISMARTSDPNSASGQFFICSADCSWLDGQYAAFGKTVSKEDDKVVLEVSKVPTCAPHPAFSDFPQEVIGIKTINLIEK